MKIELEDNSGFLHIAEKCWISSPVRVEKDGVTLLEGAHEDGEFQTFGVEFSQDLKVPGTQQTVETHHCPSSKTLGKHTRKLNRNCGASLVLMSSVNFPRLLLNLDAASVESVDTPQEDDEQEAVQFLREDSLKLMNSWTLLSLLVSLSFEAKGGFQSVSVSFRKKKLPWTNKNIESMELLEKKATCWAFFLVQKKTFAAKIQLVKKSKMGEFRRLIPHLERSFFPGENVGVAQLLGSFLQVAKNLGHLEVTCFGVSVR